MVVVVVVVIVCVCVCVCVSCVCVRDIVSARMSSLLLYVHRDQKDYIRDGNRSYEGAFNLL